MSFEFEWNGDHPAADFVNKLYAGAVFVRGVGIREENADVAHRRRAQQRITDRMKQNVRIRMTC